ncbi:MAG TPA: hypothetical protein VGP72_01735 [Planctomycetota bacterium]
MEHAVEAELNKLRLPSLEIADWLKESVQATLADEAALRQSRETNLKKREVELRNKKERLFDAYLERMIDKATHDAKALEIQAELEQVQQARPETTTSIGELARVAANVIDLTQTAAERWRGSNWHGRRELLDILSLNRQLDEISLSVTWASPFDAFAEMADIKDGRGDRI